MKTLFYIKKKLSILCKSAISLSKCYKWDACDDAMNSLSTELQSLQILPIPAELIFYLETVPFKLVKPLKAEVNFDINLVAFNSYDHRRGLQNKTKLKPLNLHVNLSK